MAWYPEVGSFSVVDLDIADDSVKALPFSYSFVDQPCTILTPGSPGRQKATATGVLEFREAVARGFIVRYRYSCSGAVVQGTDVVVSIGSRRDGVWPYSLRKPGESWSEKVLQLAKDAWNGAI
jgi:hypothetical protein